MIKKTSKLTLAFTALALGIGFAATDAQAQRGHGHGGHGSVMANLVQNVYVLDNLADQMVFRYGWEVRWIRGCQCSINLYNQMKRHARLTDDLVRASRGQCGKTFAKAACDVRQSVTTLERLRKSAKVSNTVCALISQSCPPATFVHQNARFFNPYNPVPTGGSSCGSSGGYTTYDNRGRGGYRNTSSRGGISIGGFRFNF